MLAENCLTKLDKPSSKALIKTKNKMSISLVQSSVNYSKKPSRRSDSTCAMFHTFSIMRNRIGLSYVVVVELPQAPEDDPQKR